MITVNNSAVFNFRILNYGKDTEIIDRTLKTQMESLTPIMQMEYLQIEVDLYKMDRLEKKQKRENKTSFRQIFEACLGL